MTGDNEKFGASIKKIFEDYNTQEKIILKNLIKNKIEDVNNIYVGLSQDYKDGVDEGLKVALLILKDEDKKGEEK